MSDTQYSLVGIHLPPNKQLIVQLKKISFFTTLVILISSLVILLGYATNISLVKNFFIATVAIPFSIASMFFFSGLAMLIGEKLHAIVTIPHKKRLLYSLLSQSCASIVLIMSLLTMYSYLLENKIGFSLISVVATPEQKQAQFIIGILFFLISLAILIPFTTIKHRFHFVHLFTFAATVVNTTYLLSDAYQFIFPSYVSRIFTMPLVFSILFAFLCHTILLRWPARGFVGIFTTDTMASKFALRLLIITIISIPFIGLITIA